MERPDDPTEKARPYFRRGLQTRRHIYFYPADNRAGFLLMLLIGVLGLVAAGIGLKQVLRSPTIPRDGILLSTVGILAASIGLYQAIRLRRRS